VRPSNEAARALYLAAGFTEVATRRSYYPAGDGREDAIVLQLELQ
jgi:ribosomal-protein-alanine N-acetyltransferase